MKSSSFQNRISKFTPKSMALHANHGSARKSQQCMQILAVHENHGSACKSRQCMQITAVHGNHDSWCQSWQCMEIMAVHGNHGSAWKSWQCMEIMAVNVNHDSACPIFIYSYTSLTLSLYVSIFREQCDTKYKNSREKIFFVQTLKKHLNFCCIF